MRPIQRFLISTQKADFKALKSFMNSPQMTQSAVLIVDDDADVLAALSESLSGTGYRIVCSTSAEEALEALGAESFAVVISDQNMPGMKGLELLERVREIQPLCSRILITGMVVVDTLVGAINTGEIFRFIAKPWKRVEIVATVENAVHRYQLLIENQRLQSEMRVLNKTLERANESLQQQLDQLAQQQGAMDRAHDALRQNFEHSLGLCFRLISTFYPLLGKQAQAVVEICRAMSATEYFTDAERHVLMTSAWIYDIGLVALDRPLLHKLFTRPEACTPEEHALLRHHPIIGQTLAAFVDQLQEVGTTIRAHHERFDGSGYPDGHAGEMIPWTARCLAVAVAFVQSGIPKEQACEYLLEESGKGFDPEAIRLFFRTNEMSKLPRNVREVLMAELKPGMELARGIVTPSGMLLVPAGQVLNEFSISKLTNHNRLNLVTERLMIFG
jgi:response regulator RpfG family c-di-GMP phosphodiesterase